MEFNFVTSSLPVFFGLLVVRDFFETCIQCEPCSCARAFSVNTILAPWGVLVRISGSPAVRKAMKIKCCFFTKLHSKGYRIRGLLRTNWFSQIIKNLFSIKHYYIAFCKTSFYIPREFSQEIQNIYEPYLSPEVSMYTFYCLHPRWNTEVL